MSADEVLARLAEIARGDYRDYICGDGTLDIEAMVDDGKAYLIKKVNRTERHQKGGDVITRVAIEMYDSQRALETMAKHHGLLVERHEVSGAGGGPLEFFYTNDWRGAQQED